MENSGKNWALPVPKDAIKVFNTEYARGARIVGILYKCSLEVVIKRVQRADKNWQTYKKLVKITHFLANWWFTGENMQDPHANRGEWLDYIGYALAAMEGFLTCPRWSEIYKYQHPAVIELLTRSEHSHDQRQQHFKKHYHTRKRNRE